ncbi:hypothetical protein MNV49_004157 [Pseudohyphozyma bogoriensis]|nr:hypothetical protein MNV49_004157 [Pseudohyphozyma bogoriensis]
MPPARRTFYAPIHSLQLTSLSTAPTYLLPTSARHSHILRLHDLLHHLLSLPPTYATSVRAVRAWRALASCKEVDVAVLWRLGVKALQQGRGAEREEEDDGEEDEAHEERERLKAAWIKRCQNGTKDRVDKFVEYIIALVAAGRTTYALEEAESFLPSHPYHDSIALNVLAGQLALFLSQPPSSSSRDHSPTNSSNSDDEARSPRHADDPSTPTAHSQARRVVDDDDSDSETEKAVAKPWSNKKRSGPTQEDMLASYLKDCAAHSSHYYAQAQRHFRQAARLEAQDDAELSRGEGTRWDALLDGSLTSERAKKTPRLV